MQKITDYIYELRTEYDKSFVKLFLVLGSKYAVLIDSGIRSSLPGLQEMLGTVGVDKGNLKLVINTHGHWDHIGLNAVLKEKYGSLIIAHRAAVPLTEPLLNAKIKVLFHSDGYIMDILDDLIEAGIEGINPIEPLAGNDISYIKRRYGKRLVLLGNVDCSQVLPLGTTEEIRQATRECIRAASSGGAHFIGSSSEVTPAVPLENVLTFFQAAKEYGKYPIRC